MKRKLKKEIATKTPKTPQDPPKDKKKDVFIDTFMKGKGKKKRKLL